jgi:hypothetical protein
VIIKPKGNWKLHSAKGNIFKIDGILDSNYAKDCETCISVSGYIVFLSGALVTTRSKMQECVALSVIEAELVVATNMC